MMVDVYKGILKQQTTSWRFGEMFDRLNVYSSILEQTSNPQTSNIGGFGSNFSQNPELPVPYKFGTKLPVANISGKGTRPPGSKIYRELEDEGIHQPYGWSDQQI